MGDQLIDLAGQKLGKWTAIGYIGHKYWKCRCDCGTERNVLGRDLRRRQSVSCGCAAPGRPTHRLSKHPLYLVWRDMRKRCQYPKHSDYKNYGGRGIKVCEEWSQGFVPFVKWAEKNGWSPGLSLDRKDNDKGYCPENCRFATAIQQANNVRTNKIIAAFGERKTMAEWARDPRCVVSYNALQKRITKGRIPEEAISCAA